MKNLFKRLHIRGGSSSDSGSHEGGRSSSDSPAGGAGVGMNAGEVRARAEAEKDYSFLEEEFQVQLALAISVSASSTPQQARARGCGDDSDRDNLECSSSNATSAESLSRRYWDYNVLDYDEKIMDGFYDVYSSSAELNFQGPLPRLDELQQLPVSANLDYEVMLVNRVVDPTLEQLEQIALCIALECRATGLSPANSGLIQKIAEIVSNQMGGPVSDANDMLARWTIASHGLRAASNNVVVPLGCLKIGLARHRALLFKILADHVGIPCRLVKGSHYTGIDGGAVNIIKLETDKEFIIDLMGAPGTLIPGEIPSIVSAQIEEVKNLGFGQQVPVKSDENLISLLNVDENLISLLNVGGSKARGERSEEGDSGYMQNSKTVLDCSPVVPSSALAAEPSNDRDKKILKQNKFPEIRNNEFRRRRENFPSGPGRPPIARKNPVLSNNTIGESDVFEGTRVKRAVDIKGTNISLFPDSSALRSNLPPQLNHVNSNSGFMDSNASDAMAHNVIHMLEGASDGTAASCSDTSKLSNIENQKEINGNNLFGQNLVNRERKDYNKNVYIKRELQQSNNENYAKGSGYEIGRRLSNPMFVGSTKLDTVMDDVAEWEIPWEDLIIGERIGLGSYGEVYRAEWNGTEVAVKKFLDQDFSGDALQEFRSEVRIMRRLRHPNVVLFMGAVTRPPNLSIVTEFLPRGSLYRLIHKPNVQIDEKRRIRMAIDVAKGMNCLHSSTPTIVHRDLKSPNLLVDKNWAVKVCDFGLSRMKQNTFLSSKSTAGTPEWMAPEVLRNEPSNEKCDVYSFGVILWELSTLRMPWSGMNPMQVVGAVGFQNRRLDIPKEVDPLVARIIRECWQMDPSLRPSFSQLMVALKPLKRLVIPAQTDLQCSALPKEQTVASGNGP